jgi:hypothetical protein
MFDFRVKPYFPKTLSKEFLIVDLVNNLDRLAEDTEKLLGRVRQKALEIKTGALPRMARDYGSVKTKKLFNELLAESLSHAA